jgi:hypothetical protein
MTNFSLLISGILIGVINLYLIFRRKAIRKNAGILLIFYTALVGGYLLDSTGVLSVLVMLGIIVLLLELFGKK